MGGVILNQIPKEGKLVIPVGDKMKKGDLLVRANTCLYPQHVGLITAGGHTSVKIIEKPKVALLPTGNELVPPGQDVPRGMNVESNGVMMEAQLKAMGAETRLYPITRDNRDEITNAINDALSWADIVVLNGGTSKG